MSDWTPTEHVREAAFDAWQNTSASLSVRERLDAVLVAVGPMIAASAWSDGMEAGHDCTGTDPRSECFDKNPYIEKEAGR